RAVDLAAVERLAGEYPDLPIVVVGLNFSHQTGLFGLLDRTGNVFAETSLLQGFEQISRICRNWGAGRLLFGTGMPVTAPGASRAMLAYAEISEEERVAIASGNLERLLGLDRTASLSAEEDRSRIVLDVDQGRPLARIPVIDLHGHIAPPGFDGILGLSLGPQDADSIVNRIDRVGIRAVAVSSWEIDGGDTVAGNFVAAEAAAKYPGRILPYAAVNPNYPEDWRTTVEEFFRLRKFFGFKPYPTSQRRAISDPSYRDMLEFADRQGLPILCHLGFEPLAGVSPGEIRLLAPRYPRAQFLLAHSGASYRLADTVIPLALEFDNVWLEINYTSVPFGMLAYLAEQAGTEKVLFGTDTPMRDPSPILGWVVYDHLADSQRAAILGGNALALMAKTGFSLPG
ncbi:MAG: amidohydrolase family protein, partial [Candidatus Glassbacteria bacterium]